MENGDGDERHDAGPPLPLVDEGMERLRSKYWERLSYIHIAKARCALLKACGDDDDAAAGEGGVGAAQEEAFRAAVAAVRRHYDCMLDVFDDDAYDVAEQLCVLADDYCLALLRAEGADAVARAARARVAVLRAVGLDEDDGVQPFDNLAIGGNVQQLFGLLRRLLRAGDARRARRVCREAMKAFAPLRSDFYDPLAIVGMACELRGQWAAALRAYAELRRHFPKDLEERLGLEDPQNPGAWPWVDLTAEGVPHGTLDERTTRCMTKELRRRGVA